MNFNLVFEKYLECIKVEKKVETYNCYSAHLKNILHCLSFLGIYKSDDITNDFYLNFVKYYKNKNCCNRTINKRLILFKSACKYSKIYYDFFEQARLKEEQVRYDVLSDLDLVNVIKYIKKLPNDDISLVNKVAILLLIDTGVRANELVNIEIKNINFNDNSILLTTTKVDIDRLVFFSKDTEVLIRLLIKNSSSKKLLYNYRRNSEYTYRTLTCFISKIKKDLNIKVLHPHMFRHTFATNLVDKEAPIFMVQLLLGHTDIRTTQNYVHLSSKRLKKCYDEYAYY